MQFLSDNAAPVHPRVWQAMRAADPADKPYDEDALSAQLDAAFTQLFGRECAVLWAATGTAANCLALATMVAPHGAVICHEQAHIERDEGGAPGFFLHGAKLLLTGGAEGKLTPDAVRGILAGITRGVHQVPAHAISLTQANEFGLCYTSDELAAIRHLAREAGLGFHIDGARFANAVAHLGCPAAQAAGGADALSFGLVKNGGMNAEAIVFFDPAAAEIARWRRKRAGHLQSKGRFLAAQLLALLENDLWLANARKANDAAQIIASAISERLLFPVEANEVFCRVSAQEREKLRAAGFGFYDWGPSSARFVTDWASNPEHAEALGTMIAQL